MSFIQRELDRLGRALREPQAPDSHVKLYAAQQALAWAMEPDGFASPMRTIMGTQEGLADCSGPLHHPQSSGTCGQCG